MTEIMQLAFWQVATALTVLIVPIIALWVFFNIVSGLLFGKK